MSPGTGGRWQRGRWGRTLLCLQHSPEAGWQTIMIPRKDNEPHPIDVYVGGRMRLRRIQLGLSQGALASKIGVSFQAVQKYESGDIRISASRLYDVAQVLQVSPAFFFEGYPDGLVAKNLAQEVAPDVNETFDRREIMSLIRGYYGIKDPQLQADILRLISKLGHRAEDEEQSPHAAE